MIKIKFSLFFIMVFSTVIFAGNKIFPSADEYTPSRAEYFSWINNTNEGATEKQTVINLNFFKWLKDEFGMQLDIYAFDAGAIDGKRFYGSTDSKRFKRQFPNGFNPLYKKAKEINIRLGIWGGPDGFGKNSKEEEKRIEQMVKLCRDYNFALFKFDAVCGHLRAEKESAFIKMMKKCRDYSPDLILLNHRLGLREAEKYATTFLWEGAETYIDVFMTNSTTAPHHRAGALSRGLVPGLKRLTEDHGVCISSCPDGWDDDLILQAFNRNLILSPQIYGNPWFLEDREFPKLARIYNLHRKYRKILVKGMVLPKKDYGPYAVSRGNGYIRLLTLRNLSWNPVKYNIALGDEIGIKGLESVKLIQLHPYEKFIGIFKHNNRVEVTVAPYHSALFLATTREYNEPFIKGAPFGVIRNVFDKTILIDIFGKSGTDVSIGLGNFNRYKKVYINGVEDQTLLSGKKKKLNFPGEKIKFETNGKIAVMRESDIPEDVSALYEATVFAADNNALEVRSLLRSGKTSIPEVKMARDAFFKQKTFIERGVWDKNLFDGNRKTGFWPSHKYDVDLRVKRGAFRLDLGKVIRLDKLVIYVPDKYSLHPLLTEEGNYAEISADLKTWRRVTYLAGLKMIIPVNGKIRYLRLKVQPGQIVEIEGYYNGKMIDRKSWRASNLFAHPDRMSCKKSWKASFTLKQIPKNSYLSIAINGKHGVEGAYAAAKIGKKYIGAPDRAPSFPSNTWEYLVAKRSGNYTYYIPLKQSYKDKKIEVWVMGYDKSNLNFKPDIYLSSKGDGMEKIRMEIER